MAAMKIIHNPMFLDETQDQSGDSSPSSSPPPQPYLNPLSQHNLKEKPPDMDDDGFQPVRNRRRSQAFPVKCPATLQKSRAAPLQSKAAPRNQSYRSAHPILEARSASRNVQPGSDRPTQGQDTQNKAQSWAEMVKNEGRSSDFDLRYVEPLTINKKRIIVMKEDVSSRTEAKWCNSVVAYVFGNRPAYHHFKDFISRTWNPSGKFEIYLRNNGFFVIKFSNAMDSDKAINGGPYFINGKLIILKKWNKKLKFDKDLLTSMPIWIRLPELSLKLWDKDAFSAIASIVGNPLKLDEHTAKETRLSYARILVEINADAELPEEAHITMHDGEIIVQNIEYEWIPPRCKVCSCFGHCIENCSAKMVWKEKNSYGNNVVRSQPVAENGGNTDSLQKEDNSKMDNASAEVNATENRNGQARMNNTFMMQSETSQIHSEMDTESSEKNLQDPIQNVNKSDGDIETSPSKDALSLNTESGKMNVDEPFNIPVGLPESTDISKLGCHLAPKPRKSVSQQSIQKAVKLVSSTSPPTSKKKKRNKLKRMKDILGPNNSDDAEDDEFRKKYISRNKEWDYLKIKNKQSYKKKSRKLDISEEEDSFSDSL